MSAPQTTCTVREGRFVDPCDTLDRMVENQFSAFSRAKGITRWAYTNMKTREPSRTFFGVKCRAQPNGILFNFCPFCGAQIDVPFVGHGDQA
jgi:hypothetical protein